MKNNATFDIFYKGYEEKFGNSVRPALSRVEDSPDFDEDGNLLSDDYIGRWRLFIDGEKFEQSFRASDYSDKPQTGIYLLRPNLKYSNQQIGDQEKKLSTNLTAYSFDEEQSSDWYYLFWDYIQLRNLGAPMVHANIAMALNTNLVKPVPISQAIKQFSVQEQETILQVIEWIAWSLAPSKITWVIKLLEIFGKKTNICPPADIIDAAKAIGDFQPAKKVRCSIIELADSVIKRWQDLDREAPSNLCPFMEFIRCLDGGEEVPIEYYERFFPYLDDNYRTLAVRHYFYEIKKGNVKYSDKTRDVFLSPNFYYYSEFRYIYQQWPLDRNVSIEFLFDCLSTYEKTNQENFQVYNGILDLIINQAISRKGPIDFNIRNWLLECTGGVCRNTYFKGFADFLIKYEFDELNFEEEPLEDSIQTLIQRSSTQRYHFEEEIILDSKTGEPIIDEKSGKPKTHNRTIYENVWDIIKDDKGDWKPIADLFVNWDIKDDFKIKEGKVSYSKKMIDKSIVRAKVLEYSRKKFGTETPTISYRAENIVTQLFGSQIEMSAKMYEDTTLGAYDKEMAIEDVREKVCSKLTDLFGETLCCDYDAKVLSEACRQSLFTKKGTQKECFINSKKFVYKYPRYCSPYLSENLSPITEKRTADCDRESCYATCIKKEPDWRMYRLAHLLEIIGYDILEKTDAGYIPKHSYNTFVIQINKAIKFYKHLKCRECGHILFPVQSNPQQRNLYRNFKCLNPFCTEYNKVVYINYCFQCKSGIIDSRDSKKCPNGKYICPTCKSCCSNEMFDREVQDRQLKGKPIYARLAAMQGNGHKDRYMYFCPKCGTQMLLRSDSAPDDYRNYFCPDCDRPNEEGIGPDVAPPPIEDDYQFQDYES